ncbi:chromosome partition protein smc family protein, putative [Entamoeba histolytica HM-1:IMSS-B]|uniref:Kinetochore protein NDC80 n=4 Tax=Entamoeba histolytica TaxID=5759 RepID=C4LVV0_ENTH1|nr:chromosome partition protein smc homolog, putative [Entamoeba histolytica HM-1:IMSS]EAL51129.1 chromosome partition protein smc homolog, putative [Entamoeba histolytica HM-1:IMSS]EMH75957.1 chromosome partition protein smc family protein, putative [Entamoeba histolytica HM-1:IMSS-B]ENY61837.1 chromosome partition protein smc family protein, putative [Entamoeba histolytica HM-1:IMSS-A]GAT92806.1 chromosome partition protein smc homolog putative [Entamoeba histolytica]|eukprot:XP_656516.1 chromosome partition protein smc homolog, putative [Entamoeba histolytica HM-1:IMSS]
MLSNRTKIKTRKADEFYQLHDFMSTSQPKHIDNRPWHINVEYRTQKWNELVSFLEQLNYEDYCLTKTQTENYKVTLRDLKRIKEELPTSREYIIMVELLARRIIPNFVVHEGREEQTLSLLFSMLGHNFNANQLSHVSAPHCWSFMLGSLTWLKDAGDVVCEGIDAMKQDLLDEDELVEETIAMECEQCALQSCVNHQTELMVSKKLEEMISTRMSELETLKDDLTLKLSRLNEEINEMSYVPYAVENLKLQCEEIINQRKVLEEERINYRNERDVKKGILQQRESEEKSLKNELQNVLEEKKQLDSKVGKGKDLEMLEIQNEEQKKEINRLNEHLKEEIIAVKNEEQELNIVIEQVKELIKKTEKEVPIDKNNLMDKVTLENIQNSLEVLQKNIIQCKTIQKANEEKIKNLNTTSGQIKKEIDELKQVEKGIEEAINTTEKKWKIIITKRNKIEEEIKSIEEKYASIDRTEYEKEFKEATKLGDQLALLNKEIEELNHQRVQQEQRLNFIKEKTLEKNNRLIEVYKNYIQEYQNKIQIVDEKMKDVKVSVFNAFKEVGIQQSSYLPKN